MAYVNVAEWKPDQVTEWLKGLDSAISQNYLPLFSKNEVNGQQLLNVRPEDLDHLGIKRLGHQELLLEAVEHLRNFHYELDRENLQLLALRLSCQAHSLHNELLRHTDSQPVSTQTLADVASVVRAVKPLVCWLDRSPFCGQLEYADRKSELLTRSMEIATCAQRDRFAERPVHEIRTSCASLAILADGIIQDIADPLILQPASLDLVTLRKRPGDDLGFFIVPSFHGVHQIGEIKFGSPAHQCGKVEEGDEVVQVNYQTVVGWQRKKVMALFEEESLTDVFLTLKKRPRHTKVYGQIYMKPYRLPSKKRAPAYTRWHENLPSPRPELLTIPDFEMPLPRSAPKTPPSKHTSYEPLGNAILSASSESDDGGSGCDEAFLDSELEGHASPTSMRLYLPKPRVPVQRRATITGGSPTSHRPPVDLEKFWRELKEKKWKGSNFSAPSHDGAEDSRVLRGKSPSEHAERPSTCLGFEKSPRNISFEQIVHSPIMKSKICTNTDFNPYLIEHKALDKSQSGNVVNGAFETFDVAVQEKRGQQNGMHFQEAGADELKTNNQENDSREKRYITRLELMVDPQDSKIQYSEIDKGHDWQLSNTSNSTETVPSPQDSPFVDNNHGLKEIHRKISAESQPGELPSIRHRERGRLDKSYSTPAYDLSEVEGLDVKSKSIKKKPVPVKLERKVICKPDSSGKENESPIEEVRKISNSAEKEPSSTTMIASTNMSFPVVSDQPQATREYSTHAVFKFPPPSNTPSCTFINQRFEFDNTVSLNLELERSVKCDSNSNPVLHGRVVETINRHLLDSSLGKEDDDDCGNACDVIKIGRSPTLPTHDIVLPSPDILCDIQFRKSEDDIQNGNGDSQSLKSYDCNQNSADGSVLNCKVDNIDSKLNKTPRIVINCGHVDQRIKDHDLDTNHSPPSSTSSPGDYRKQAPVPPIGHNLHELQDLTASPLQPKVPLKISANTPPEPPPRPSQPTRSPSAQTEQSKGSTLRAIISGKTGTQKAAFSSPKVTRKKNPLIAKRRKVGMKELGAVDYQGWLYRRLRQGGSGAKWIKGWFLLKGTTFYGFKTREAPKADCFISLPGFTASQAEEVKSRRFAFKVYHTGTVFYFAAESEEELAAWLDCVSMATLAFDPSTHSVCEGPVFSETEDECEEPEVTESCFPSPKMRKLTNFLSGHTSGHSGHTPSTTASSPKPAHSHQNLASHGDSKTHDIQKKFGSLKKLGYRNRQSSTNPPNPQPSSSANSLSVSDSGQESPSVSAPHSLDRKYLRFLSSSKSQNVPVPTAQFRSYRRVVASDNCSTLPVSSKGDGRSDTGICDVNISVGERSPHVQRFTSAQHMVDVDLRRGIRGPGSIRADEMAGLVTLEQFMLLRQEDERQQQQHQLLHQQQLQHNHQHHLQHGLYGGSGRDRDRDAVPINTAPVHRDPNEAYTGYTEDPVTSLQRSLERRRTPPPPPLHASVRPTPAARTTFNVTERHIERSAERPAVAPRTGKKTSDSHEHRDAPSSSKHAKQPLSDTPVRPLLESKQPRLKNAALYQPPPVAFAASPNFGPTFEMHLDQQGAVGMDEEGCSPRGKGSGSKFRQLFTPKYAHAPPPHRPDQQGTIPGPSTPPKTILGSPLLHRAFFGHTDTRRQKGVARSDSTGYSLNSGVPSASSSPVSFPDWALEYSSSPKPTMGVSMLGKKSSPIVSPLGNMTNLSAMSPPLSPPQTPQTPLSPPPDYPGLEYPPVFEPGTYSLSDSSTLLQQSPSTQVSLGTYNPETPDQSPSHHFSPR